METNRIADLQVLPFWVDVVGVCYLAADQILRPCEAVKSAPSLTHLDEPRPDIFRRRVDRNGVRDLPCGSRQQRIAG